MIKVIDLAGWTAGFIAFAVSFFIFYGESAELGSSLFAASFVFAFVWCTVRVIRWMVQLGMSKE